MSSNIPLTFNGGWLGEIVVSRVTAPLSTRENTNGETTNDRTSGRRWSERRDLGVSIIVVGMTDGGEHVFCSQKTDGWWTYTRGALSSRNLPSSLFVEWWGTFPCPTACDTGRGRHPTLWTSKRRFSIINKFCCTSYDLTCDPSSTSSLSDFPFRHGDGKSPVGVARWEVRSSTGSWSSRFGKDFSVT